VKRLYLYGYRFGEVLLPKLDPVKKDLQISEPREVDLNFRPPVQVSLGCNVQGVALPHADPHDPKTTRIGVMKRAGRAMPSSKRVELGKLQAFVRKYVRGHLPRVSLSQDLSVETWLENCKGYSAARKQELREKWAAFTCIDDPQQKYKHVKAFMKDEVYTEFKHPRGIYSRSDEFKCLIGPIAKVMESIVYSDHHFIKHVPVAERAKYISDLLYRPGVIYGATDYTSYEAQFVKEMMEVCEFELYSYLTEDLPEHPEFIRLCDQVLAGENRIKFRDFVVRILATRMSGEMVTSLGNGFSNLMFMLYECEKLGNTHTEGVVEGDDGLFVTNGPFPTTEDFAELGLIIKIELHTELNTASFCGQVFDPFDCVNVCDVRKVLATFGWTSRQYARSSNKKLKTLLRSKALSLAYQYPGCPVICALAEYGLRVTKSYSVKNVLYTNIKLSSWERELMIEAADAGVPSVFRIPPIRTRLLVERLYGVTVETQVHLEKYLNSLDSLVELEIPLLVDSMPSVWTQYYTQYNAWTLPNSKLLDYPSGLQRELSEPT